MPSDVIISPILLHSIENRSWKKVVEILDAPPYVAPIGRTLKKQTLKGRKHSRAEYICSPIMFALHFNPPLEVIKALLRAHPDAASMGDKFGQLPLHYAINRSRYDVSPPLDIFLTLLDAHPAAASIHTRTGLPLHNVVHRPLGLYETPASIKLVAALLAAYPEAAAIEQVSTYRLPDLSGRLPDFSAYPAADIFAELKNAAVERRSHAMLAWWRMRHTK